MDSLRQILQATKVIQDEVDRLELGTVKRSAYDDMLAALELGDSAGNNGPMLLVGAAKLLEVFAPVSAMSLRRKAEAERLAIEKARNQEVTDA